MSYCCCSLSFLLLAVSSCHGGGCEWVSVNEMPKQVGTWMGSSWNPASGWGLVVGGYSSNQAHAGSHYSMLASVSDGGVNLVWERGKDYPKDVLGNLCLVNSSWVWCSGGDDGNGHILTDSYGAVPNSTSGQFSDWSKSCSLPRPLHFHGGTMWRGEVPLVFGGRTDDDAPTDTVWALGPGCSWEVAGTLPVKVSDIAVTVLERNSSEGGDIVYVGGGQIGNERDLRCSLRNVWSASISRLPNGSVSVGPWRNETDYPSSINYNSANTTLPDTGIKAYHWMAVRSGHLFVFPAAAFSSAGPCKQDDTKFLSSTMHSFTAPINPADGSLGQWTMVGGSGWGLDSLNYKSSTEGGMGSNVYGLFPTGRYAFLLGGMNYAKMLSTVFRLDLDACISSLK